MNKLEKNFNLDVTMAILYLVIMEPKLTGLALHEWVGLSLGIVFIIHILFHWDWIVEATKRYFEKFPKKSKLNYALDILLIIGSFFILLSGLPISRKIGFSWLGIEGDIIMWQHLHVAVAFLTLLVIAIHIGLHWKWAVNALKKVGQYEIKNFTLLVKSLFIIIITSLGLYSFYYTDYFNTVINNLDYNNYPSLTQNGNNYSSISTQTNNLLNSTDTIRSKGSGRGTGGGGRGSGSGYPSYTVTTDSSSVLAYSGIAIFIVLVVYYLEIMINKIFRKKKKILLNKS